MCLYYKSITVAILAQGFLCAFLVCTSCVHFLCAVLHLSEDDGRPHEGEVHEGGDRRGRERGQRPKLLLQLGPQLICLDNPVQEHYLRVRASNPDPPDAKADQPAG